MELQTQRTDLTPGQMKDKRELVNLKMEIRKLLIVSPDKETKMKTLRLRLKRYSEE